MEIRDFTRGVKRGFKTFFKVKQQAVNLKDDLLCDDLPFESAEAYKLLRANLMFSIPGNDECKILGVTSAIRGECKSTVAINLAYTVAQSGKKVLLIDADMRLPSVAKKLGITGRPGLSNAIVGLSQLNEAVRHSGKIDTWDVLPAGSISPNPSELLGTDKMKKIVEELRKVYDFIIFDLPPVTIVSDAMVVSSFVDGYILVVRENYSDKGSLIQCMRQMKVIESKILGFVMTASTKTEKGYYKHYRKYGYEYSRQRYGYDTSKAGNGGFNEKAQKAVNGEED